MAKEYIEREKALNDDRWNSVILSHDRERAREIILCQPAADVVEVVRGRWIKLDMRKGIEQFKCSICRSECYVPTCMGEPMYAFCPNCGKSMDGERRDNNATD